jgi:hypothetical protein
LQRGKVMKQGDNVLSFYESPNEREETVPLNPERQRGASR